MLSPPTSIFIHNIFPLFINPKIFNTFVIMAKPNKEHIITDILIELEKGIERFECLAIVGKKWQLSIRTFDRHWKTANERHLINQEAIQKELASMSMEAEKERLKKAILSKDERMEILTQIATGQIPLQKPIVCDGIIQTFEVVPDWMDRKNAIAELNKMDGSYSPIKQEISGTLNMPLMNIDPLSDATDHSTQEDSGT